MVSIIIPCYNGQNFVERCLNSILSQTYKDLEVIIINDGSTDNSEYMIKMFESKFNDCNMKLIYIYQDNKGAGGAINTGLKYVSRKYLTLLDIDDYLMPDSIELKVHFLEENKDFDIVRTNGYYVSEHNLDDESQLFVTSESEKNTIHIFDDLIEGKTNNWAGSYMIRIDKLFAFYRDREIYASRYGQNLQILLPLAYKGKSGFIDKPLMKYIRQEKSLSRSTNNINFEVDNMLGYKSIRKYMIELILKDMECKRYLQILEIVYARCFIYLAAKYNNLELMEKNYIILREFNSLNIDDRITYYNLKNKPLSIILRIVRKISNLFNNFIKYFSIYFRIFTRNGA